jgi:hypothetical protein
MELNTGRSKTIFTTVIILSAILSLSVFANAFAVEEQQKSNTDKAVDAVKEARKLLGGDKPPSGGLDCCIHGKKFISLEGGGANIILDDTNSNGRHGLHHNKIDKINRLFRSDGNDNIGSSAIDNIPVIPPTNFTAATNETTANVTTTTSCNGIVSGLCLDQNTG